MKIILYQYLWMILTNRMKSLVHRLCIMFLYWTTWVNVQPHDMTWSNALDQITHLSPKQIIFEGWKTHVGTVKAFFKMLCKLCMFPAVMRYLQHGVGFKSYFNHNLWLVTWLGLTYLWPEIQCRLELKDFWYFRKLKWSVLAMCFPRPHSGLDIIRDVGCDLVVRARWLRLQCKCLDYISTQSVC